MGRIDLVVFPNGGREIFGQIGEAEAERISAAIEAFLPTLESSNRARKHTGYYDAPDASDIEWLAYDENNPIVQVPVEAEDAPPLDDAGMRKPYVSPAYESMELAQVPAEQRAALDPALWPKAKQPV